jgi:hypothetical protein
MNKERLCLTPLSIIFQLFRGGQFYWWSKPEYPKKKHNLFVKTDRHEIIEILLKVALNTLTLGSSFSS